jgi:nitrogenase-stabilizing/protective protein
MHELVARLQALSAAEDFFAFLGLPYDAHVVHVNRLHILKRFRQYLARDGVLEGDDEVEALRRCRAALAQAHADFTTSTAQREKLFKVFQDADGTGHVSLQNLRKTLPASASNVSAEARAAA